MIRHFNYTGRRRIQREDARVSVRCNGDGVAIFSVELSLERYDLPHDARVFVEAYRPTSFMRFPWGTVGLLVPAHDRALTEFGNADGALFRVKVVEPSDESGGRPARLLALADKLRPVRLEESAQQSQSLLEVMSAELDEIWKVDFGDGGEPILLVNQRIEAEHQGLVRSDPFASLVLPQVFRTILRQILVAERFDAIEDGAAWQALWLQYSRSLPGVGDVPRPADAPDGRLENLDEMEDWIEAAVGAFARKFHVERRFEDWWQEGRAS